MHLPYFLVFISIIVISGNVYHSSSNVVQFGNSQKNSNIDTSQNSLNKNFWDNIYQNSILNTKTKYNTLSGEKVCFTCPIDRDTFQLLFHQAKKRNDNPDEAPPRITIAWATQLSDNRMIFFCRNNTRMSKSAVYLGSDNSDNGPDGGELDYTCENDRLCLNNLRHNYPENYQCLVKSYVLNVKLNVIVQLQYVILYFAGDSVKFDYQKEVQVYENHPFTVKCEVPETNPVSNVNAYIDGKELKLTKLEKKTIDNRMSINTYFFQINATREMNGKSVKCEASMKDIPTELASSIDLRSYISKDYTLSVYYLPSCVYPERIYKTGINRSLIIECPINASNPEVTYYKMIPPSSRTKYELIDNGLESLKKIGRYKINPQSRHDFGLYECIPRSLAGTTKCDIHIELGATPNPPEFCNVQFAVVNNKTFAQFSCKPGFNQGGKISFLTIYEVDLPSKELKLSGRVNIDEGKINQEVPFITPAKKDHYYEFLIMQENNYGNSTSIVLTLGVNNKAEAVTFWNDKKTVYLGAIAGLIAFIVLLCCCCCLTDICSSTKNDNPCCKCCQPSDSLDEDGSTYKKAPMDGDASGNLINQPFQGFSSTTKIGNSGIINNSSTYEYYDNTSTGLLTETYSRNYINKSNGRKKSSSYDEDEENYSDDNNNHGEDDHDHYMNSSHRKLKHQYVDSSEESSGSSTDRKIYGEHYGFLGSKGKIAYTSNNDPIESYPRNLKTAQANPYAPNTNNYSTIDSKKFIKTDNGLVYTPLNGDILKKSTDALMIDDEEHLDSKYHLEENYEDLCQQRILNKVSNTYSSVKKSSHMPLTNKALFGVAPPLQNDFKNELNLKLKSFNGNKDAVNSSYNNGSKENYQIEQQILTATTSLSSASSCTSNSELVKESGRKLAPLAQTNESINKQEANLNQQKPNNNTYSLLKTTLNVKGASETLDEALAMNQFNSGNTLRKSQTKLNSNCTNKPPILKPKPRTNNTSSTNVLKSKYSPYDNSMHSQSGDMLISNFKETSLQTSPSTSVTDVSSTNLTPQHNNNMLIDDITSAQLNNLVKPNNYQRNIQNYQSRGIANNTNGIHKATTTFTSNPNTDGLIYSTTKINGDLNGDLVTSCINASNVNGTLRTYESTTLNRKLNRNDDDTAKSKTNSRTLERRHIQNSEC